MGDTECSGTCLATPYFTPAQQPFRDQSKTTCPTEVYSAPGSTAHKDGGGGILLCWKARRRGSPSFAGAFGRTARSQRGPACAVRAESDRLSNRGISRQKSARRLQKRYQLKQTLAYKGQFRTGCEVCLRGHPRTPHRSRLFAVRAWDAKTPALQRAGRAHRFTKRDTV